MVVRVVQKMRQAQMKQTFDQIARKGTQVEKLNYQRIFGVMSLVKVIASNMGGQNSNSGASVKSDGGDQHLARVAFNLIGSHSKA